MVVDTTLKLSCHRTIEQAERVTHWLKRRGEIAGHANRALRDSIEKSTVELHRLAEAAERPPALGLVGGTDSEKSEFITALLRPEGQSGRIILGQRRAGLGAIASILPGEDEGGVSMMVRFRDAPPGGSDNDREAYPIEVRLVSHIDLAAIITLLCHTYLPSSATGTVSAKVVGAALEAAQAELRVNAVPGLSRRDILQLRDFLATQLPRADNLNKLASLGYWHWFADNVAQLSEAGRRSLLALLWGHEPRLNRLFAHLGDALNRLGNPSSVLCQHDALISSDPATGWVARHKASVASAATLQNLANETVTTGNLRLSTGGNTVFEMDRATFAAIASEITLGVEGTRLKRLAPAEIVAFPGIGRLSDTTARLALHARAPQANGMPADIAVRLFTRAKSTYLFQRACQRMDVTSLIVRADPHAEDDDLNAVALADWVDLAQGEGPAARERMETGLAIVASRLGSRANPFDGNGAPGGDAGSRPELAAIAAGGNWLGEWTPGRGFPQTYWLTDDPAAGAAPGNVLKLSADGAGGGGEAARIAERITHARRAELEAIADRILTDILPACSPTVKTRQIRLRLSAAHRQLRARLMRYQRTNEPARLADWRRQIANVAASRIVTALQASRLPRLWAGLCPSEDDLATVLGAALSRQAAGETTSAARSVSAREAATTVMAHWMATMYAAAHSQRLSRDVRISQAVLEHVVDELTLGAHRLALADILAREFARIGESGRPASSLAARYAATATRLIGAYLEAPAPFAWTDAGENEADRQQSLIEARPDAGPGSTAVATMVRPVERRTSESANRWPSAFIELVERNIATADALAANSEIDRELGEHLSVFAANPFEVEL